MGDEITSCRSTNRGIFVSSGSELWTLIKNSRSKFKKSKTYSGWCSYQGLSTLCRLIWPDKTFKLCRPPQSSRSSQHLWKRNDIEEKKHDFFTYISFFLGSGWPSHIRFRILKIDFLGNGDWRQSSSSFSTFLDPGAAPYHRFVSGGSNLGIALTKTSQSPKNFSSGQTPDPYLLLLPYIFISTSVPIFSYKNWFGLEY